MIKILSRLMLKSTDVDDVVNYLTARITEYDQQIVRAHATISKLIMKACLSVSGHGQPFHKTPTNEWVSLDASLPKLKIEPIRQMVTAALANQYDVLIVRPKSDFVDINKYNSVCINVHTPIYNNPPYYNVFAYPKLMWYCLQVIWQRSKIKQLSKQIKTLDIQTKEIKIQSIISDLVDKINNLTYCTQILYNQYITYGDNVFQRLYGVNFCRPKEQELLVKDGYYYFIAEITGGKLYTDATSAPLYQKVLKN